MAFISTAAKGGSSSGSGTEIGYDQITAPVTIASTTESAGTLVIQAAAYTFDGSAVIAEFYAPAVYNGTTANNTARVCLFEGATEIGQFTATFVGGSVGVAGTVYGRLKFTPTAGSHTYKVTAFCDTGASGTPQVQCGAGGTGAKLPSFLRFTKA